MEQTTNLTIKKTGSFTTGELLRAFNVEFLDEKYCREWIIKQMHGDKPACPGCGYRNDQTVKYWEGKLVKCKLCDKWFTALTDTFLSCAQLNYRQIYLLALLFAIHHNNQTIADILQVSPETVRRWRHKFEEIGALNFEEIGALNK